MSGYGFGGFLDEPQPQDFYGDSCGIHDVTGSRPACLLAATRGEVIDEFL